MGLDRWLEKAKKDGIIRDEPTKKEETIKESEKVGLNPTEKEYKEYTDEEGLKWIITPRGLKFPIESEKEKKGAFYVPSKGKRLHERFAKAYPEIQKWMNTFIEGTSTYRKYPRLFLSFCIDNDISPKEFGELWKTREDETKARQIVAAYIQSFMNTNPNTAQQMVQAIRNFFRHYSGGIILSLDTKRGGALWISPSTKEKRERRRYSFGSRDEMREKLAHIIPICSRDLKDEMALTMLYRAGIRDNVLNNLKVKDVRDRFKVEHPITGEKIEVLCLTITSELDSKIRSYGFPKLLDTDGQPRGYYTFLTRDSLRMFDSFMETYHRNSSLETLLFSQPMGGSDFVGHLRRRIKGRLRKADYPHKEIWLHQLRACFSELAHENVEHNKAEMLSGHLLKGTQEHYQKRNKTDLAKEYLKIKFTPKETMEDLKQKFIEEQRERLAKEEQITRLETTVRDAGLKVPEEPTTWKPPTFEEEAPSLETSPPIVKAPPLKPKPPTISQAEQQREDIHKRQERITERVEEKKPIEVPLGPPPDPKYCLRGLTFVGEKDDSFCHTACAKGYQTQYQACQQGKAELRKERPDLVIN